MLVLPVTNGFVEKRSSSSEFSISNISSVRMACWHTEISLGVSGVFKPTFDLNHCLFSSIRLISVMGASQIMDARRVISSNCFSGKVSKTLYCFRAFNRWFSLFGIGFSLLIANLSFIHGGYYFRNVLKALFIFRYIFTYA